MRHDGAHVLREIAPAFIAAADVEDPSTREALFARVEGRDLSSPALLEEWILEVEEIRAALQEARALRRIRAASNVADGESADAYQRCLRDVIEPARSRLHRLDEAYLRSPARSSLSQERFAIYDRLVESRAATVCPANAALRTEIDRLCHEYDRIVSAMTIGWEGRELSFESAQELLHSSDRALRERAWQRLAERQLREREALDDLFDELLHRRRELARRAGESDYASFRFRELRRFDYERSDCRRFRDAAESVFVPLLERVAERRRRSLGVDRLRPWDVDVPIEPRGARAFASVDELVEGALVVVARIDAELGDQLRWLRDAGLLDVAHRPHKAPGGFQETFGMRRLPYLFANLTGANRDLRQLVHEAGHAFHAIACREEPLFSYRSPPIEFGEVASLTLELLVLHHLRVIFDERESAAFRAGLFERVATVPVSASLGDAFQEWLYTQETTSREARDAAWADLHARSFSFVDWSGLEDVRRGRWQHTRHFYQVPFYFIDYGLAQVGALQIWTRVRDEGERAIARFRAALALGGSERLPRLFQAAGAGFRFDRPALSPLAELVSEQLALVDEVETTRTRAASG
jgi:oligoendopeptidase F